MAITASDTGNQFADAWKAADVAVTGMPANPTADQQAYGDAWNNEAKGIYGSTAVGTPTAVPTVNPADVPPPPLFTQQNTWDANNHKNPLSFANVNAPGYNKNLRGLESTGGYGTFKYGDDLPERGTQQWRDMSEYLAMGGQDPNGYLKSAVYQDSWNNAPSTTYTGVDTNGQYGT